jgi:pSer/pThr/pTyr-binding forkhead associated (FHA) protein
VNAGRTAEYSVYIQDLGSVNGTQVNDEQLDMFVPRRLVDGDKVTVGVEARFCMRAVQRRF